MAGGGEGTNPPGYTESVLLIVGTTAKFDATITVNTDVTGADVFVGIALGDGNYIELAEASGVDFTADMPLDLQTIFGGYVEWLVAEPLGFRQLDVYVYGGSPEIPEFYITQGLEVSAESPFLIAAAGGLWGESSYPNIWDNIKTVTAYPDVLTHFDFVVWALNAVTLPAGTISIDLYDDNNTLLENIYTNDGDVTLVGSETAESLNGVTGANLSFTTPSTPGKYMIGIVFYDTAQPEINEWGQFWIEVLEEAPTIKGATLGDGSITQAESTTLTVTTDEDATVVAIIDGETYVLGGTGTTHTTTIYGTDFSAEAHAITIYAFNSGGADTDTSLTLTVTQPTDEIKYILSTTAAAIEARADLSSFVGRVYHTGQFPSQDNAKATPPMIVLELNDGDPRKAPLYSKGGVYQRIEYITVRTHLIFKRDHKKTIDGTLYETSQLANYYKKELQSCLENLRFSALNIDDISVSGGTYTEEAGTTMLYGCIFDLTIGYQTLEA